MLYHTPGAPFRSQSRPCWWGFGAESLKQLWQIGAAANGREPWATVLNPQQPHKELTEHDTFAEAPREC